jgi:hypothetical protein
MQLWLFQVKLHYMVTWIDIENQNDILHTGYKNKGQKFSTLS